MHDIDPKILELLLKIGLKNVYFDDKTPIASTFYQINIDNLYSAIDFVYKLPYRAPSEPFDWTLVLKQRCGTCSTRHALLVSLAQELGVAFELGSAIYPMTPKNFPMLRESLQRISLPYIPESHNFIVYRSYFLDITFPGACKLLMPGELLAVKTIAVEVLRDVKTKQYPEFLQAWLNQHAKEVTVEQYRQAHNEWVKILEDYFIIK